jgi:hypothetical protein
MPLRPATAWLLGPVLAAALGTCLGARGDEPTPRPDEPSKAEKDRLAMTPGVVCKSIDARGNYEPLPGAAMTADEKLLIYFCPRNYQVEHSEGAYRIHLSEDGQIRRKGQKEVLRRKDKLLEYKYSDASPPTPIYLKNTVSLKGLKPGEYEFDITLHDKLGDAPAATQTIGFRVIPAVLPESEADPGDAPAPRTKPRSRPGRRPRGGAKARR